MGEICPIALTEALGCDKCHHIFVVRADGYTLEQLSSTYPYKQVWYWTGKEWCLINPRIHHAGCFWMVGVLCFLFMGMLSLPWFLRIPLDRHVVVWMVLTILIAIILMFMVWFAMSQQS